MFFKQFGGKVRPEHLEIYQKSEHWRDGHFQNLEETDMGVSLSNIPSVIWKQLTTRKEQRPKEVLPILPFDRNTFLAPSGTAKFIWYGHSAILMRIHNRTILIDPMLGSDTTPIAPVANKRFSENTLDLIDEFPEIDLVVLTHDHYDHLDYASIQRLKAKTKRYFVAMGVKRHLVSWGIDANLIEEFDWWESRSLADIKITFTPTRHFSGRGLTDRFKTLWGGWVFKTENENIWFSGDGGYGTHFKEIGKRFGSFDFAFMECGQYNYDWHELHLFPHESVQAAIDANVKKIMPVHWAGFALSYQHTWQEPAEEFLQSAKEKEIEHAVPPLGKLFQINSIEVNPWWRQYW
ncbi:MAG: MBL fold metallo-hydrolase [Bacteroidota bacterium]